MLCVAPLFASHWGEKKVGYLRTVRPRPTTDQMEYYSDTEGEATDMESAEAPSTGGEDICMQDDESDVCHPSALSRPTGFCKRFARNIPAHLPNLDRFTGIRRKVISPFLDNEVCLNKGECEDATDDFGQSQLCGDERYSGLKFELGNLRGMPWSTCTSAVNENVCAGGVSGSVSPHDDPVTKLRKLICQEAAEIDSSNAYLDRAVGLDQHKKGFKEVQAQFRSKYNANQSPMDSELEPELAAALLQSEEQGAALKHIPPASLFGRLFPEDRSKPIIRVTAASKRRRGLVMPLREGLQQEEQLMEDVDAGIVDFYNINDVDEARHFSIGQQPIPEPIKHEVEGTSDQVFGLQADSNDAQEERKPFKYIVTSEPPLHGNYAQLRGSEPPNWFPGYFTVQPGSAGLFRLDEPYESLEKAWASMGPTQVGTPYGSVLLGKP